MKCACEQPSCFYCDVRLSVRHEHDHWPTAQRHGGTSTIPVCLNCHDLKDRIPLHRWPDGLWVDAMKDSGPLGRLLLAKVGAIFADFYADRDAA